MLLLLLFSRFSVTEEVEFLPELLHNVELLADQAESDILHIDRQMQHERNRVVNLQHEREMLRKTLDKERQELERVASVKGLLSKLTERSQPNSSEPLSLDECAASFHRLQTEFRHEYVVYGLGRLAVPVVFPLIKEAIIGWQAHSSSDVSCLNILHQWKELLGSSAANSSASVPSEDE